MNKTMNPPVEIIDQHQKDILTAYGYDPDTFRLIEAESHIDRHNEPAFIENEGIQKFLVPASIAGQVSLVTTDFTHTAIRFLDKDDNELLSTVGRGYDDLVTPTAICVEPVEECIECS